ncbi:hypothetical protein Q604_UNBC05172G0001, partial [human gut metagenome]
LCKGDVKYILIPVFLILPGNRELFSEKLIMIAPYKYHDDKRILFIDLNKMTKSIDP